VNIHGREDNQSRAVGERKQEGKKARKQESKKERKKERKKVIRAIDLRGVGN
jgi:hypothetical protein